LPWTQVAESGIVGSMLSAIFTVCTMALVLALPAAAGAALHTLGREFRPTSAERAGFDSCTAADASSAALVFRCNRSHPDAACPNPNIGKLFAEWRTPEGELDGEPVLVAEGSYNYGIPFACSADGLIAVVTGAAARVIGRNGERGMTSPICAGGPCWGPFAIAPRGGGFLVVWPRYQHGLFGRSIDSDGQATGEPFLIAATPQDAAVHAVGAIPVGSDDGVLIAWKVREPDGDRVRATLVSPDDSVDPGIVASEFPSIEMSAGLTVTPDGAGAFVLAWQNEPAQAGWVARRILLQDAAPTTSTTTTTIDAPLSAQFVPVTEIGAPSFGDERFAEHAPELVGDGEGNWFASWLDLIPTPPYQHVGSKASHSSDDGRNWSVPQPHANGENLQYTNSRIAQDTSGVAIEAWARDDQAAVLFRRSSDGGHTWTDTGVLAESVVEMREDDGEREMRAIAVAAGAAGRWVAAWTEYAGEYVWCSGDDDESDCIDYESITTLSCAIRYSISTDGGVSWSPSAVLVEDVCWTQLGLEIATDRNGDWLAVWARQDVVYGSHSQDDAQSWAAPRALTSEVEFQRSPAWQDPSRPALAIAANTQGKWLLALSAWLPDPPEVWPFTHARVVVMRTDDLAGDWSALTGVAPWHDSLDGRDLSPALAVSADGQFALAWSTHSAGTGLDADIVAAFSDDGGQSWNAPVVVDGQAANDPSGDFHPRIVRAGATWGIAWLAIESPETRAIRFTRTRGNCGNGVVEVPEECDDANVIEGDGCDSTCRVSGCGSHIVTGNEQCDDGNTIDTDSCISCVMAVCGDAHTRGGVEECDDGNDVDTDACRNDCMQAVCGDGVLRPGIEQCDDGETSGNNDECRNDCTSSTCGDGYIHVGEEECDDGNTLNGDGCSKHCHLVPDCGFLNGSGVRVKASDAAKVLRRALGIISTCPLRRCDVNDDGSVTATDALSTLRSAVGIFRAGCSWPTSLVVRMASSEKLGALQIDVSWADAAGHVLSDADGSPACEVVAPATLSSINWYPDRSVILLGLVSSGGMQGPLDILRCSYDPVAGPSLHDFRVEVTDASDLQANPVVPAPTLTAVMQ